MSSRVAAASALAIVLTIAAGTSVWVARVHAVTDAIAQQRQLARVLFDARAALDESTARSLIRPGLHVVLTDFAGGHVFDALGATVARRSLPPAPGDLAAPGAPDGGLPPGAPDGSPLPGVPDAGPPRAGDGPRRLLPALAGALARIAPARVGGDTGAVTISPDLDSLALWLLVDVLAIVLAIAAIVVAATTRATAGARAERRALEATSEERRETAERYQRFLAETAHELRTPLTIVGGYVDILRASTAAQGFDERIIDGMRAETARMRVLVGKMLTLARLESPAGIPRLIDVAAATQATVETMQRRYPDRCISLVAGRAGRIVIDGDDLADALGNLIENAIKYAPGVEIAIAATTHDSRATISVSDRGPGIAPDEREKIFERFYRGRSHDSADGLGLGLAIVRGVADRWGGSVLVESVPGRTVFTLAFPVADEEVHALAG